MTPTAKGIPILTVGDAGWTVSDMGTGAKYESIYLTSLCSSLVLQSFVSQKSGQVGVWAVWQLCWLQKVAGVVPFI